MNVTGQNANMYGTVLNGAVNPITTAGTAQNALLNPAVTAYNTGIGLANTGYSGVNTVNSLKLGAYNANQQNSGGGFFGGLLGGLFF